MKRRLFSRGNDVAAAPRAEETLLAGRRLVSRELLFTPHPAEILPRDAAGGGESGGMRLAARDAVAMPHGVEAVDLVRDGATMAASFHLTLLRIRK